MKPKYQIDQGIYYLGKDTVYVYYITEIKISNYDPKEPYVEYHFHNGYRYTEDVLDKEIKKKEYFVSEVQAQKLLIAKLQKEILKFKKEQEKLIGKAEERIRIVTEKQNEKQKKTRKGV